MSIRVIAFIALFQILFFSPLSGSNICTDTINVNKDTAVNKTLLRDVTIGAATLYAGSMIGLYSLWYSDYPQSSFHFINDNNEWLQLDKAGHITSSYYLGVIGYESLVLTGIEQNKATWIGGSFGLFYLTAVETLDGFSAGWGASGGDLLANFTGTACFISQQLLWKEQRIRFKWSVHTTKYAAYRPDLLGSNFPQRILKDYNGHTYWLSGNIRDFLKEDSHFPAWINVAVGYSGTGMVGARSNPAVYEDIMLPTFDRYRRYFLSPDIDLTKIKVNNKTASYIFKVLGFIKLPMPAIEFNHKGIQFHALYF